ncbi:MAG: NAD(P)H-hydrate dehydratase [candidate division KSB1 bacterium]|nr:NAD(P)H-hydrate dehydratase [candidate division KSB1 bacterium]
MLYAAVPEEKIKGDARTNLDILKNMHPVQFLNRAPDSLPRADLVVDALLGTGVKGALRGLIAECADVINSAGYPVLSVDIPTGVNTDTGIVKGPAVRADVTATMALLKRGLLFSPGREHAGRTDIIDISMPAQVIRERDTGVYQYDRADIRALLPVRSKDTYKNKCGTVAVIAGSTGLTGAAVMSSFSTLRAGAGMTFLIAPARINAILESQLPEVITLPMDDARLGYLHAGCAAELMTEIKDKDVLAVGPGLGQHKETAKLVHQILQEQDKPLILDADGLNVCAGHTEKLKNYQGDLVITPHPGELSRLLNTPVPDLIRDRIATARDTAAKFQCTVVLKGAPTVTATAEGHVFINPTGNAGMATAGSGDVLTGIISGLSAQGLAPATAAALGVYLHGLAGDLAAQQTGSAGMTACDIMNNVALAIKQETETR